MPPPASPLPLLPSHHFTLMHFHICFSASEPCSFLEGDGGRPNVVFGGSLPLLRQTLPRVASYSPLLKRAYVEVGSGAEDVSGNLRGKSFLHHRALLQRDNLSPSRGKPRFLSPSPSASATIPAEAEKQALAKRGAIAGKTGGGGEGEARMPPPSQSLPQQFLPTSLIFFSSPQRFLFARLLCLALPPSLETCSCAAGREGKNAREGGSR